MADVKAVEHMIVWCKHVETFRLQHAWHGWKKKKKFRAVAWEQFKAFYKDVDVIETSHREFTLAEVAALEKELAASLEQETGVGVGDAAAPGDGDGAAISGSL